MRSTAKTIAGLLIFLMGQLALAQANISMPNRPAPEGSEPQSSDCRPQASVAPDGTTEFTDCSGKKTRVERGKIDPRAPAPHQVQPAVQPASTSADSLDAQTQTRYQEALRAQLDYQTYSYNHAKRTFEFQYWSGKVIFWTVLFLVFAGVAFSAVQFYVGLRHPLQSKAGSVKEETASDTASSEFEASLTGIKFKSSILGLLILAMSMVFFYLYLKYVYPISNVSS